MKLIEEFKELVPDTLNFNVRYFEGQGHSKIWFVTREGFSTMYRKYPRGEITLWCDGQSEEEEDLGCRKKCKRDESVSKRQGKEEAVDDIFKQLKEKHGEKYDTPRLHLWARSIGSKIHDDLDSPPDLSAFRKETGLKKSVKKDSLTDALTGAVLAFANKYTSDNTKSPPACKQPSTPTCWNFSW